MSQQFRREYCHVQPLVSYNGNRISQRKKKKNIQQQNSSSYVRHYNVDALLWLDLLSVS